MRKIFMPLKIISAVSALCVLSGCAASYNYLNKSTTQFFSTSTVAVAFYGGDTGIGYSEVGSALDSAYEIEYKIDGLLSPTTDGSDIYNFNSAAAGERVEIDKITYAAIEQCKTLYSLTDGAYNPAVYMLVDLWGFTPRFNDDGEAVEEYDRADFESELPDEKYISAFIELTDFSAVELFESGGKYYAVKPAVTVEVDGVEYSMKIDLGGYGKGYAADLMIESLIENGVNDGYISIGESSLYMLSYPYADEEWNMNLKYPTFDENYQSELYAAFPFENGGVSTSGVYERYYRIEDRIYSHIIDSATGEPINNGMFTATVAGGSAADCDALTTALCVMGKDRAIEFVNANLRDRYVVFACQGDDNIIEVYTNISDDVFTLGASVGEAELVLCAVGDGSGGIKTISDL